MSEFDYQEEYNDDFDDANFIDFDNDVEEPRQKMSKRNKDRTFRDVEKWHEDKRLRDNTDNLWDDNNYYNDDYDYDDFN